jgi:methyl-accepting chemotaxis protein
MQYRNWPMIWKVVSLLLLLGAASLGGAYYATSQFYVIDDLDTAIIDGPAAAETNMSRSNRFIAMTEAAIYETILARSEEGKAAALRERQADVASYDEQVAIARKLVPQLSDRLDAQVARFHAAIENSCSETIRLANASAAPEGSVAATIEMEKSCKPVLDATIKASSSVNAELAKLKNVQNAETTEIAHRSARLTLSAIAAVIVMLAGLAALVIRSGVVQPIRSMMGVMEALGRGELDGPVSGTDRRDEIGAMARTLETLRVQLRAAEAARLEQARIEAAGKAQIMRRNALSEAFVARMQQLAVGFSQQSNDVAGAAKSLSVTAEETSSQSQTVASAAQEAASNVQTVAASSEEMAASVREISAQVGHSARVADTAYSEAEASNARIAQLAAAAASIGDVVNLINGIAGQTNLLALNATIEAARAGEAGKGFAVVASEVKQLAAQTSKATEVIGVKVSEIQQATEGTVKSMTEIVRVIGNIKDIAASIAGAVEEQGAATSEIARNCQQAATGASQVTRNISGISQAAEMTGTASTQLMSLSGGLSAQATDLRQLVETFVHDLDAA